MAENQQMVVYAAAYESENAALDDLAAIEGLHDDKLIGTVDMAMIDLGTASPTWSGARPRIRFIPEMFGGGTLPRKELVEAAKQLTANQAGLIAIGELTIEQGLDKALAKAVKVVKRNVNATADQITSELQEALKG